MFEMFSGGLDAKPILWATVVLELELGAEAGNSGWGVERAGPLAPGLLQRPGWGWSKTGNGKTAPAFVT